MSTPEKSKIRSRGEGSVFQKPDGRWPAQGTLGRDPDGKKIRCSVTASTKTEVLAKLQVATSRVYAENPDSVVLKLVFHELDRSALPDPDRERREVHALVDETLARFLAEIEADR